MSDIRTNLPEDRPAKLKELATGLGTSPEQLVRAGIEDLFDRTTQSKICSDHSIEHPPLLQESAEA